MKRTNKRKRSESDDYFDSRCRKKRKVDDSITPVRVDTRIKSSSRQRYQLSHRIAMAKLLGYGHVPANTIGSVINTARMHLGGNLDRDPSAKTAQRCMMEAALCIDYYYATKLTQSTDLFIGIDETSKSDRRSFIEIELGGFKDGNQWGHIFKLLEVVTHTAEDLLRDIMNTINYVVQMQDEMGLEKCTKLYDFRCIIFDWTAVNTGQKGGLYQKLKREREIQWRRSHSRGALPSFVMKGCDDHLLALISKNFQKALGELADQWDCDILKTTKHHSHANGVTEFIAVFTRKFRCDWKNVFRGYLR